MPAWVVRLPPDIGRPIFTETRRMHAGRPQVRTSARHVAISEGSGHHPRREHSGRGAKPEIGYETIDCNVAEDVVTIVLSRPEVMNAMNVRMRVELHHSILNRTVDARSTWSGWKRHCARPSPKFPESCPSCLPPR